MFGVKNVTFEHEVCEFNQGINEVFILDGLLVFAVEPVFGNAVEVVDLFVELEELVEGVDFLTRYYYAFSQDADHFQLGEVVVDYLPEQRRYY